MTKIMPDTPSPGWDAGAVIDWLLKKGRFKPDMQALVHGLGDRMLECGAPLWRFRLSTRTLHPLITAVTSVWERDSGQTERVESTHGMEQRSGYVGSPLAMISETGETYRKNLEAPLSAEDHNILHELKARGATDYYGLPMPLSDGTLTIMVAVTDSGRGFSDHDIAQFDRIAANLAPITEVFKTRRIALALAEAYLGPRTGQRVLEGRITRGDIETITAAILVSDIRDWTGINQRLSSADALAMANRYFEIIADAVQANGGEILKFIGDGVLAIFPSDNDISEEQACGRALNAARQALRLAQSVDPPLECSFGTGLHFGEVLYGNVGSQTRIDFTVLGQAVNLAARIEGLCSRFDEPVLFSDSFAGHLAEPSRMVAETALKGFEGAFTIHSIAESDRSSLVE